MIPAEFCYLSMSVFLSLPTLTLVLFLALRMIVAVPVLQTSFPFKVHTSCLLYQNWIVLSAFELPRGSLAAGRRVA